MLRKLAKIVVTVLWLVPGILLWASFPPFGEKMDAIFALAPLLWLARRGDRRKATRTWFLNGAIFWLATLSWMPAIVKNGGPWPLVALGWFALAAYCALYFGAFGWLSSTAWLWARRGEYWRRLCVIIFAEPILWAGLELVRSRLFGGFAWNQLGIPAINAGFGEPASVGGVYLVSAMVVLVSGTLASVAERMLVGFDRIKIDDGIPKWLRSVETLIPFAIVYLIYTASANSAIQQSDDPTVPQSNNHLSVALVQRNFPCIFERHGNENPLEEYSRLFASAAALRPQLVVLSESALSEFGSIGSERAKLFADFAMRNTGANALLAGGGRRDAERREYNSAALYTQGGLQTYDKAHLVPFGEFIPLDKTFTSLQKLAPVGSCTPGELTLLDSNGIKIGVAICYEDTDSAQIRRIAEMGAQVLAFITNDSWFSHSEETIQHAWHSIARAIETGLPVVRVGNSGVTGTISATGVTNWLGDDNGKPRIDSQGVMVDCIIPATGTTATPYVRFGDKPLAIAFALILLALLADRLRPKPHTHTAQYLNTPTSQPENMI